MRRLLLLLTLAAAPAMAQVPSVYRTNSDPTGVACSYSLSPVLIWNTGSATQTCYCSSGTSLYVCVAGSGGTPGGSDTHVQINNAGAFGGEAAFSYVLATNTLTLDNLTGLDQIVTQTPTTLSAAELDRLDGKDAALLDANDNLNADNIGSGTLADARIASTIARDSELPVAANPTGTAGLSVVNGVAATFLRSDGAPAISQAITPTWTGEHRFSEPQQWDTYDGWYTPSASTFGKPSGITTRFRMATDEPAASGGDAAGSLAGADSELRLCMGYNWSLTSGCNVRENTSDYGLVQKYVWGWTEAGGDRRAESHFQIMPIDGTSNWNLETWNIVNLDGTGTAVSADLVFRMESADTTMALNKDGVAFMGARQGGGDVEINGGAGGGSLYFGGSGGGKIKFEGTVADSFETELTARNPTAARTPQLPDASGMLHLNPYDTNVGTTMFADGTDAAFDTGTEVCSGAGLNCFDAYIFNSTAFEDEACATVIAAATCTAGSTPFACCTGSGTWTCNGLFIAFCRRT